MKVGFGYDIHRLIKGRKLVLGGVEIPFALGEQAYSDGDVLIHAVIDALLGAAALGDIGTYFPSDNLEFKDISSRILLARAHDMVKKEGYLINNIDCSIVLEKPKLQSYRDAIISSLAGILHISENQVNVKAKTKEGIDGTGAGKAAEAYAVVLLQSK